MFSFSLLCLVVYKNLELLFVFFVTVEVKPSPLPLRSRPHLPWVGKVRKWGAKVVSLPTPQIQCSVCQSGAGQFKIPPLPTHTAHLKGGLKSHGEVRRRGRRRRGKGLRVVQQRPQEWERRTLHASKDWRRGRFSFLVRLLPDFSSSPRYDIALGVWYVKPSGCVLFLCAVGIAGVCFNPSPKFCLLTSPVGFLFLSLVSTSLLPSLSSLH